MSLLFNRVKMTVSGTPGTGTVTLLAAYSNAFCTFAEAGVTNGIVVSYVIEDGLNFEVGIGTYTVAGTTLSRDTVRLSKSGGVAGTSKISATSAAIVYIDAAKEDILNVAQNLSDVASASTALSNLSGVATSRTLTAAGLVTGGGDLSANRTFTVTAAVQSDQETGSSTSVAVVPGVMQYHPSACKAWVRFNASGTVAASYNITSVTDGGVGKWTVNIATDFSSANYDGCAFGGVNDTTVSTEIPLLYNIGAAPAAGTFTIWAMTSVGAFGDPSSSVNVICAEFFGDQ